MQQLLDPQVRKRTDEWDYYLDDLIKNIFYRMIEHSETYLHKQPFISSSVGNMLIFDVEQSK